MTQPRRLYPRPSDVPVAIAPTARRRALPSATFPEEARQPALLADDIAFAERMAGKRPLKDAEPVGFFTNVRANIVRNVGEIGAGFANLAGREETADQIREFFDVGYEQRAKLEDISKAWDDGRYAGVVKEILSFSVEHGLGSIPWFLAAINAPTMVAGAASMTGLIAEERAKNNGREEIILEDVAKAAPAAIASILLTKFEAGALLGRGVGAARPATSALGTAAKAGKTGAIVGAEEALQETIEYAGATAGTEAGSTLEGAKYAALTGLVAGGPLGVGGGAISGAVDLARARAHNRASGAVAPDESQAVGEAGTTPPGPAPTPQPVSVESTPVPKPAAATVDSDVRQATQEAREKAAPVQEPAVEAKTGSDVRDIFQRVESRNKEVRDVIRKLNEGQLDVNRLDDLSASSLFKFGSIIEFPGTELPYAQYLPAIKAFVAQQQAQDRVLDETPPPSAEDILPTQPEEVAPGVQEPVAVPTAEVRPEPVSVPEAEEARTSEPVPAAQPKAAPKPKTKAPRVTLRQARRRAGELRVSPAGTVKDITTRVARAEEEIRLAEEHRASTKFVGEESLDPDVADSAFRDVSQMLKTGSEVLAVQATVHEKRLASALARRKAKPSASEEGGYVRDRAEIAEFKRDAAKLRALHEEFVTADTEAARREILDESVSILEGRTQAVSAAKGKIKESVQAGTKIFEAKRKGRKERASRAHSKPPVTKKEPEVRTASGAKVEVKKKRTRGWARRERAVEAIQALTQARNPRASAEDIRMEAQSAAATVVMSHPETKRLIMTPEWQALSLPPGLQNEVRKAAADVARVASRKVAKSEVLAARDALDVELRKVAEHLEQPATVPTPSISDTDAEIKQILEDQAQKERALADLEAIQEPEEVLEEDQRRIASYHQQNQTSMDSAGLRDATPHREVMPNKMAAALAGRIRQVVTRPGQTGNDLVAGLLSATQGFGRSDDIRRSRRMLRVLQGIDLSDVSIRSESGLGKRGTYDYAANMVVLNEDLLTDPARYIQTATHELVHAVTVYQLRNSNDIATRLEAIRAYVDDIVQIPGQETVYASENRYGLTDIYEFVAEGLNNPEFQATLNSIALPTRLQPSTDWKGRIRSVWDALVDVVRTALGMDPRARSALSAFLQEASPLLNTEAMRAGQNAFRLRKRDLMQQAVLDPNTGRRAGWREPEQMASPERVPASTVDAVKKGYKNPARSTWLWSVPRDVILRQYRRFFRNNQTGDNPLEDIVYHQRETSGTYHFRWSKDAPLVREMTETLGDPKKAGAMKDMFKIALRSTMGSVHPDKSWSHTNNRFAAVPKGRLQGREELHAELQREWKALRRKPGGAEAQKFYHQMQKTLKDTFQDLRGATLRFYARLEGITDPAALKKIEQIKTLNDLDQIIQDHDLVPKTATKLEQALERFSHNVEGPYFPLRRTGEFVTYGVRKEKKEFKTEDELYDYADRLRADYPGASVLVSDKGGQYKLRATIRYMAQSATQVEAEQLAEALRGEGFKDVGAGRRRDAKLPIDTPLNELVAIAKEKTNNPAAAEAIREALMQMLPEARHLNSQLRRNYIEGASPEMLQSFAQQQTASHRAFAHLNHSHEIQEAYAEAEKLISAREKQAGKTTESVRMRDVVNELRTRQRMASETYGTGVGGRIMRHIGQVTFMRYLLDASHLILNMTQVPLVTVPQLNGIYGVRRTARAMANAYVDLTPRILQSGTSKKTRTIFGNLPFLSPSTLLEDVKEDIKQSNRLTSVQRADLEKLFERAQRQGVLNSLQSEEMVAVGQGETWLDRVSRTWSGPAQYVEFMNRLVTLHAAYNLALERPGATKDTAIAEAITHTRETHFDYSVENRPRWAFNPVGRLFGVFKTHAMGMLFRMGDYTVKLGDKETRKEGAKQLAWMFGTHAAVAGALGSIMAEPIRWAFWMTGLVFDDEDDVAEVWDDPDTFFRQATHDLLGEERDEIASWLMNGLSPGFGSRVGLDALLFRGGPEPTDTAADIGQKMVLGLGGAPVAYGMDLLKAVEYAQDGDWSKVFQKTVPVKQFANLARMQDMATSGITDSKGNLLVSEDEFGFWPLLTQAIGFTPDKKQQVYMARAVKYRQEKVAQQRAAELRQRYYEADRGDRSEVWQEIRRFNQLNPAERVTMGSLRKGLRRRAKQERETVRGVYFHGGERQRYYNEQTQFSTLE